MNKDQVKAILMKKGIRLEDLLQNTLMLEKACGIVYKAIPMPFRWFVGKGRIRNMILSLQGRVKPENLSASRKSVSGRM